MMKKITDLWFWEGIHCTTEDEAIKICKLMNEAELVRRSNKKISEEDTHRDDTRWNWITYFPKEWVYWNDKYDWKKNKYTIYPAVLFYLREEVVETKDWVDECVDEIFEYQRSWPYGETDYVNVRKIIEKHCPLFQTKSWLL